MAIKTPAAKKDTQPSKAAAVKKERDPATINSLSAFKAANDDQASRVDAGWMVKWSAIEEEPEFNPRDYDSEESVAHIRKLADAYKRGEKLPRILVVVRANKVLVRDGHHRLRAIALAVKEGVPIEKVAVDEFVGDELEQAKIPLKTQGQLGLTFLQKAAQYQKFKNWGWSDERIGSEFGLTGERIRQTLELLRLPMGMKELVRKQHIKPSLALSLFKEYGQDAEGHVKKAIEGQQAEQLKKQTEAGIAALRGDGLLDQEKGAGSESADPDKSEPIKITNKHIIKHATGSRVAPKKIPRQVVEFMTAGVRAVTARLEDVKIENDLYYVPLSLEEYEQFKALRDQVGNSEPATPPKEAEDQMPLDMDDKEGN